MDFASRVIARLGDPTTRTGLFDELALRQLVRAAYTEAAAVDAPFSPIFDQLDLGVTPKASGTVEGVWGAAGGSSRTEAMFRVAGIGQAPGARIDAVWRGGIVARTIAQNDRVADVAVAWPTTAGIDEELVAAGGLPADPVALEAARRARYLARIRADMNHGPALSDGALDKWLHRLGASSVGELVARDAATRSGAVTTVTFNEAPAVAPTPLTLPFSAVLLIRDEQTSLADLMAATREAWQQVRDDGFDQKPDVPWPIHNELVVAWLLPAAVFDDDHWPGDTAGLTNAEARELRRTAAGNWLADQGIGLVAIDLP